MSTLTIADLTKDAEREFRAALHHELVLETCETFGESHYRGGFRLVLANETGSFEVLYSDMQLEVSLNGREVFGTKVHAGFKGNMFSREHLREYLPRIAASAAAAAQISDAQG
jgi:hypothetical protein